MAPASSLPFPFMRQKEPRILFRNVPAKSLPTSPQQPLTHSVSDIERQPLSGAPRGQILATYVALLGYVLIRSKYLWGREESEYLRLGQSTRDGLQCQVGEASKGRPKASECHPLCAPQGTQPS